MIVDNLGKERRRLGEYLPEVFETCLANFQLIVDNRSKIKIISYKE